MHDLRGFSTLVLSFFYCYYYSLSGEVVTKQPLVAGMRTVKKETLKLLSCWVSRCQDIGMVSYMGSMDKIHFNLRCTCHMHACNHV